MPTNIEIKARVDSHEKLLPVVASLADTGPERVAQDDTFFSCPNSPARTAGSSFEFSTMVAALGIEEGALVRGAYVDLLAAASATQALHVMP
jgi:adenylate cyclase class IV